MSILMVLKGLPLSYSKDLQEVKKVYLIALIVCTFVSMHSTDWI